MMCMLARGNNASARLCLKTVMRLREHVESAHQPGVTQTEWLSGTWKGRWLESARSDLSRAVPSCARERIAYSETAGTRMGNACVRMDSQMSNDQRDEPDKEGCEISQNSVET